MSLSCPGKVCLHAPSRTSQSFALASHAPETKERPSGARDRDITSPVWPRNEVHCCPVSMSQRALKYSRFGVINEVLFTLKPYKIFYVFCISQCLQDSLKFTTIWGNKCSKFKCQSESILNKSQWKIVPWIIINFGKI